MSNFDSTEAIGEQGLLQFIDQMNELRFAAKLPTRYMPAKIDGQLTMVDDPQMYARHERGKQYSVGPLAA